MFAQTPTPSPEFWEKVETNIFGNKSFVLKKLEEVQTPNVSFAINDNGIMVLTFATFTGTVNQHFVSIDNGKSWRVVIWESPVWNGQETHAKYKPCSGVFSNKNLFLSECCGNEEGCIIQSIDGTSWTYFDSFDNFRDRNLTSFHNRTWEIQKGNTSDMVDKYWLKIKRNQFYNAIGTVEIESDEDFASRERLGKPFGKDGVIWKSCEGKYYCQYDPHNGVYYSNDGIKYQPFLTNLCEVKTGYSDWQRKNTYTYENNYSPVFISNHMFINGWGKNWRNEEKTYSLFYSGNEKLFISIGTQINSEQVRYNPKTKKFYLYLDGLGLFQSKKTYECDCLPKQSLDIDYCSGTSFSIKSHIEKVTPIMQPNHTACWAACAAMMHLFHTTQNPVVKGNEQEVIMNALYEIEKIGEGGENYFYNIFKNSNNNTGGICQKPSLIWTGDCALINGRYSEETKLFNKMGLARINMPKTPQEYKDILNNSGPMLIIRPAECIPGQPRHGMILTGVYSDGMINNTYFMVIDPWARDENGKPLKEGCKEKCYSFSDLFHGCVWDFAVYADMYVQPPKWEILSGPNSCKKVYNEYGKAWVIGMDDRIYFQNGNGWKEYPGGGTAIDITVFNSVPYVIGSNGYIYKGTGNGWVSFEGGGTGKSIFCDKGTLWVVGSDDAIYSFKGNSWLQYPGGKQAIDIAVSDGTPYVIGMDNAVYVGTGTGWRKVAGKAGKRIFYEGGKIWIIGADDKVYYHEGKDWVLYPADGQGVDISAINGIPYVIGIDNAIYKGQ